MPVHTALKKFITTTMNCHKSARQRACHELDHPCSAQTLSEVWERSELLNEMQLWEHDCLLHDRHLWNSHDQQNKNIDHLDVEQLGKLCGLLNSQDHGISAIPALHMPLPETTMKTASRHVTGLLVHTGHDAEHLGPDDNRREHDARSITASNTSIAHATAAVEAGWPQHNCPFPECLATRACESQQTSQEHATAAYDDERGHAQTSGAGWWCGVWCVVCGAECVGEGEGEGEGTRRRREEGGRGRGGC